jgi:antagonist of KipI
MIHVESAGLFTTVQDLGRPGFAHLGVSASGACDPLALRLGNRLLGNPEGSPALEMTLQGGRFTFPDGALIALTGSAFDSPIPLNITHRIAANDTLTIGRSQSGARCYLCVRGGIDTPLIFGSASTHILSRLGGHEGRALRRGDILPIGPEPATPPKHRLRAQFSPRSTLRVTDAPQSSHFALEAFYASTYTVTSDANRMGLRLQGTPLTSGIPGDMITEGVSLGAIQIPAGGQPVILFVEQQTTGGYPKIANVIAADLPSLGQLKPGDRIRFTRVDMREAREALYIQERLIQSENSYA